MISVTIKNKEKQVITLNSRKIEKIEMINDTVVYMENGVKIRVEETAEEIKARIIEFEASIIKKSNS